MAFQQVPESAEADVLYLQNGETIQMTFYAEFPGGYSQGDINGLAASVDSRVGTAFLPLQTNDCAYVRTEVRGLDQIVDLQASNSASAGPGADINAGFPNQVTYAVQRNSGLTGRSSRGRVFWIGLHRLDLSSDENFLVTINAVAIVAAIENMRTGLTANGWNAVIVSRFTLGAKRAVGVTFPWVNTIGTDLRVDTLRGRLP